MKTCSTCKQSKSCLNFGKLKSQKDGLHYSCKSCRKLESQKRYLAKKEEIKKQTKDYYHNNLEKNRIDRKNYYSTKYKEKAKEIAKKWNKNHKGFVNFLNKTRRANKKQQTPKWINKDKVKKIYLLCEKITKETGIIHHVDHIVPLQGKFVSGLHWEYNLQIITATENLRKHNRWIS